MGLGYVRFSYAEDRDIHIIPGIKHILNTVIELIEKSGQTAPLTSHDVDTKVNELITRYFA